MKSTGVTTLRVSAVRLFMLALTAAASVPACATAEETVVTTTHRANIMGKSLAYTAEAGRIAIRDVATGEPHGYMFYTAYRVASTRTRPLMFVWNGGPGADSSLLHFSAAGPRRLEGGHLIDNAESWLGFADLVLVDPIGTGFSRASRREHESEFYGTVGDVASVTEFVRAWRIQHRAESAPTWLAGESWGAGRAASVGYQLQQRGIDIAGLVLISGGWGLNESNVPKSLRQALTLVDMATAAAHHGRGPLQASEQLQAFRQSVETWVRDTYAPALERIDTLTPEQRTALSAELAHWAGVPTDAIDAKTLTISPRAFRKALLRDRNQEPYIFDLRQTTPPEAAPAPVLLSYWRDDLGYRTDLPYIGLEPVSVGYAPNNESPESVGARWNYATAQLSQAEIDSAIAAAVASGDGPPKLGPPLPGSAELIALNPNVHVLVAGGMYDSFVPCAVGAEIEARLPEKLKHAMTFRCYAGGHAMYLDASERRALAEDIGALVKGQWPLPVSIKARR